MKSKVAFFSFLLASPLLTKAAPIPSDTVMLEALDVVAVKQLPDLSKMAVSASSIGSAAVEQLDIADIKRISDIVPNFYIPDYGSRITSSIYVRGIGARMDQPAVGLNIDNVPILNKDAYDLDLADIAQVEMLRGPQSSLYGRNTMTGLINIRTLSPMKWQGWRAMLQGSLPLGLKGSAGWYHKFNERAALGASLGFLFDRGEFRNDCDGKFIDKERSGNLRLKFEWRPSAALNVSNVFSTGILRQGGWPYENVESGRIAYNDTCFYRRFLLSDGLSLSWNVGKVSFLSVTSAQYIDDNMTLDQDFLPQRFFTLTQKKQELSLTEDIMARGVAAGGKYSWLGGLFAFYRHNSMQAPVTFYDDGIANLIESHRNEANPRYPIRWNSRNFTLSSDFTLPSFGVALYHESRLNLGVWHLSAGLRLDYEDVRLRSHSYCSTGYAIYDNVSQQLPVAAGTPVMRNVVIDIDDRNSLHRRFLTLIPKVSALFDLPDYLGNVYASVGKGYKAGGFNTQMFSDVLQQRLMGIMGIGTDYELDEVVGYKPEKCWSFEVGTHLSLFSSALTADVSLFYIDITDQQLTRFPPGSTTGRLMSNAGRTRSMGGELSLAWRPFSFLDLNASWGFTDARFRRFNDGVADYKGKFLPYAPRNTLWLQALFTVTDRGWLGRNSLLFDLNLRGSGRIYWNEANSRYQNMYHLLGASVTFQAPEWEVQLWGRNLTDTDFKTFYFLSMGNEFMQRGRGVSAGVTLRLNLRS